MKSPTLTSSAAFSILAAVDGGCSEADVVGDGAGEEEGVLQDDAEAAAEGGEVLLADVEAVDEDLAALDVVEAHHERR